MEFKNDVLGASFTLPEKVTVRMQLAYLSNAIIARGRDMLERYWLGAVGIMRDWKCELIPDPAALDLDTADNPKIVEVILWAGLEVKSYMDHLEGVPKN
jgi:hypothetical protein